MQKERRGGFFGGKRLLDHAKAQDHPLYVRGRINELFPYVYEASKRMGVRAISRWFTEEGQPISAATISRALANPYPYWEEFSKLVEPHAAFVFGKNKRHREALFQEQGGMAHDHAAAFNELVDKTKEKLDFHSMSREDIEQLEEATGFLRDNWFPLAKETREHCREFLIGK